MAPIPGALRRRLLFILSPTFQVGKSTPIIFQAYSLGKYITPMNVYFWPLTKKGKKGTE